MAKTLHISDYDPRWPQQFEQIRSQLWPVLEDRALSIEHVGSTAVPGLAAKPVIDVDVVIEDRGRLPAVTEALASLGYGHRGNLGIEGREAFRAPAIIGIAHHLYVCPQGSLALRNHLALRDYLRSDPAACATYGHLKRELAARSPHDIDGYIAGKSGFILAILAARGLTPRELALIEQENRLP